jgi:hypothetical protein
MSPDQVLLAYDPNDVKPGWIALVLVLILALATFLLWRSMNTQLGRIKAPHRADVAKRAQPPDATQDDVSDEPETPPAPSDDGSEPRDGSAPTS